MSIEGIALEYFGAVPKTDTNSTTPSHQRHAVFHSFYLMIEKMIYGKKMDIQTVSC